MYQSLEAKLHDAFWEAEGPPAELPLLRSFLRDHPGPSLEVGCGSGRLLLPLLAEGFEIEGLDNAPEMLALCREQTAESTPALHLGDLSTPFPRSYQSLLVPAFTLQLCQDPIVALNNLKDHLLPGGALYLTLFVPHGELSSDPPGGKWHRDRELPLPDDRLATLDSKYQINEKRRQLHRKHHWRLMEKDGTLVEEHHSEEQILWLYPSEVIATLQAMDFEVLAAFPDFDPNDDSPLEEATVFTITAKLVPALSVAEDKTS
jgi:SAM-dependent methyltransferase